jgi:hypothetical protein
MQHVAFQPARVEEPMHLHAWPPAPVRLTEGNCSLVCFCELRMERGSTSAMTAKAVTLYALPKGRPWLAIDTTPWLTIDAFQLNACLLNWCAQTRRSRPLHFQIN